MSHSFSPSHVNFGQASVPIGFSFSASWAQSGIVPSIGRIGLSMQSDSRNQDIFEMAFAGIPRVAELIAALRLEDRIRALDAAEQRYKQMARDIGVSEGAADVWAAAVMSLIRLRVVEETVQRVPTAQAGSTMSHSSTTNGPSSDADSVAHTAARNMESAAA
jgi:hypothetical protein